MDNQLSAMAPDTIQLEMMLFSKNVASIIIDYLHAEKQERPYTLSHILHKYQLKMDHRLTFKS